MEETSWNFIDGAVFARPERLGEGVVDESKVHGASEATDRTEIWMGGAVRVDIPKETFECQASLSFSTWAHYGKATLLTFHFSFVNGSGL